MFNRLINLFRNIGINTVYAEGKTSLHWATERGQVDKVKSLLAEGADVNTQDKYGDTPLHLATEKNQIEIVNVLLAKEGVDINIKGYYKKTPLHLATERSQIEIVNALLAEGADVNTQDEFGDTPLHLAAEGGHIEVANVLLAKEGVDINIKGYYNKKTPLHLAAERGCVEIVDALLTKVAYINAQDETGDTPLHRIAERGQIEGANALLAKKSIDINAKDKYGDTPLHMAARRGYKDVVNALLEKDANFLLRNNNNRTPMDLAMNDEIRQLFKDAEDEWHEIKGKKIGNTNILFDEFLQADEASLIHYTHNLKFLQGFRGSEEQYKKDYPMCAKIIDDQRQIIEKRTYLEEDASKAMERICELNKYKQDKDASKILITHLTNIELKKLIVANINAIDEIDGRALLHLAAASGQIDEVVDLLDRGAYINAKDHNGDTPLHLAAANGYSDVVEYLLKIDARNILLAEGVDVNAVNRKGETALQMAIKNGHKGIENALLAAGAEVYQSSPSTEVEKIQKSEYSSGRGV